MKMSNKVYDILNKIQRWLPAVGILYLALCQIWNLPYGQAINNTIIAVAAFLATTLEISTGLYHKDVSHDLIDGLISDTFNDESVPSKDDSVDAE